MKNNIDSSNSIFETDLWLDCVAENSWEKIEILNKNGDIDAAFPIFKSKRYGFKIVQTPALTQTLGIYIKDTGAKLTKKLEREKKLINQIIDQLPKNVNFDLNLDINNEYILPFIWRGFKVEPRFSYQLENLENLDVVWSGFKENIKTDIRKAQKKVEIRKDMGIDTLIEMQEKTFKRQNRSLPFDKELIKKIDERLGKNDASLLLCAVDEENNVHAATYFIYDEKRCYYLLSGGDPEYRNSGATSLLVWEGIKFAADHSIVFDFEGSMIEDIERFVRGFGAKPKVYYRVTKFNCILAFLDYIKPAVKRLLNYK